MSENIERMAYADAILYANDLVNTLDHFCSRIEIAGSLRRKKETIGDIEIVLIPRRGLDLFGSTMVYDDFGVEVALRAEGFHFTKNGSLYKQAYNTSIVRSGDKGPVMFDLFLTTPEKWGCIFTIRTGSAEFSHNLVTKKSIGGWCPSNLNFKDGRIWNGNHVLDTPEEADVFSALDLSWVRPEDR